MRLAFICGSLEPGRDGVGDYSRRLAGEIARRGHACALVGLNDGSVSAAQSVSQEIEGTSLPVLRLPAQGTWPERIGMARSWLLEFKPDCISFQYVPFAYHPKGMRFGLGEFLQEMNPGASWQIMFHELWLGLGKGAPLKHRIYGAFQRKITLDLVARLRPRVVHTQAAPYQRVLAREKIGARILPLFGNIPFVPGDAWDQILEPLISAARGRRASRNEFFLAGVLGGVHPEWAAETPVNALWPLAQRAGKELTLVFLGKNGLTADALRRLGASLHGRAHVVATGERSEADISRILQTLDFGLATSPRQMIQKSGSVAAMLEHGLSILVTRDDWRLREASPPPDESIPGVLTVEALARLDALPVRHPASPKNSGVQRVAEQMLAELAPGTEVLSAQVACAS
jgi:hypothetical protein